MSTEQLSRPRPRPRPRPRAAAAPASPIQSSSNGVAPSSPVVKPVVTIDEEDALFIRKPRTAQQWKKLAQIDKESKPAPAIEISDDDEDSTTSPRSRKYKKKSKQDKQLPSWTKKKIITTILSSSSSEDESDGIDALQSIDNTPNGKRPEKTAVKRKRSRSKSITPPPALPIYRIQNARNLVRQTLDTAPRAASPTWLVADDSTDNITLDPELAKIAQDIRAAPVPAHTGGEGGGPEAVTIKVKWQPHPLDDAARPTVWGFKMRRHDDFRQVFDESADMAGVLSHHLVVSYGGKRVFSSATPHSIHIWAEAELEACDKITHDYIRTHRNQRSLSPSDDPMGVDAAANSRAGTQDLSESEEDTSQGDKFKLILRSTQTSKDISLTVRPTTTCGAIIKAFLKTAGLSDKHAGQTPKKGNQGPRLCIDGEKMDPGSQIGDADLEEGDMVEVVGL